MFSGIVETKGTVVRIEREGSNYGFWIESSIAKDAYIDQSIAHNGVCLTIVKIENNQYLVTAIHETILKTNLSSWTVSYEVNLERSLMATSRIDGHFVQGHVDTTAMCVKVENADGSWYFHFSIAKEHSKYIVQKGSICINGVSLTVVVADEGHFSVAIIPYTYEHTNFCHLVSGDEVNIEFDILGKYIVSYMDKINTNKVG